jgi:hypothetical protein
MLPPDHFRAVRNLQSVQDGQFWWHAVQVCVMSLQKLLCAAAVMVSTGALQVAASYGSYGSYGEEEPSCTTLRAALALALPQLNMEIPEVCC